MVSIDHFAQRKWTSGWESKVGAGNAGQSEHCLACQRLWVLSPPTARRISGEAKILKLKKKNEINKILKRKEKKQAEH